MTAPDLDGIEARAKEDGSAMSDTDLDAVEETYAVCASVNEYGRKCRGDATERYGRWNVCERCALFLAEAERRGAPDCSVSPPPVSTSAGSPDLDGIEARANAAERVGFDKERIATLVFLAHARSDVPALIAHCRTLLARAEKADAKVAAMREALTFVDSWVDSAWLSPAASIPVTSLRVIHASVRDALALDSAKEGSR